MIVRESMIVMGLEGAILPLLIVKCLLDGKVSVSSLWLADRWAGCTLPPNVPDEEMARWLHSGEHFLRTIPHNRATGMEWLGPKTQIRTINEEAFARWLKEQIQKRVPSTRKHPVLNDELAYLALRESTVVLYVGGDTESLSGGFRQESEWREDDSVRGTVVYCLGGSDDMSLLAGCAQAVANYLRQVAGSRLAALQAISS